MPNGAQVKNVLFAHFEAVLYAFPFKFSFQDLLRTNTRPWSINRENFNSIGPIGSEIFDRKVAPSAHSIDRGRGG
jgi:hypothetical protein